MKTLNGCAPFSISLLYVFLNHYFPSLPLDTCHTNTAAKIDNLTRTNIPKTFYKVSRQRDLAIARDLPHFLRQDRVLSHPSSAASFPCDLTLVTHSSAQDRKAHHLFPQAKNGRILVFHGK